MNLLDAASPILVGLAVEPLTQQVTPTSRRALERARGLARQTGARIELVHSVPGDVFVQTDGDDVRFAYHLSERGRLALVEALREMRDAGLTVELVFRPERPKHALVERAREQRAALILIGVRERGVTVGSVARHLLSQAPCPVWAVDVGEPYQIRHVLLDAHPEDRRALRTATALCGLLGATLHRAPPPVGGVEADLVVLGSGARGARMGGSAGAAPTDPPAPQGSSGGVPFMQTLRAGTSLFVVAAQGVRQNGEEA